jgi:hypothetical protein
MASIKLCDNFLVFPPDFSVKRVCDQWIPSLKAGFLLDPTLFSATSIGTTNAFLLQHGDGR